VKPLALTGGRIWTGAHFARSLVIRDGRIESIDAAIPNDAARIDLRGRLAVPGFIDNHLHFVTGGLQLERVQLRDATTRDAFTRRIAQRAQTLGEGRWILGGGWDEQQWSPARVPSRHDIDPVTPNHPVWVTRNDLHMGVANSAALKLAGITRETPDPPGGTIARGEDGEPAGLLKDSAMALLAKVIPAPSIDERMGAIRSGLREAARCGVTAFCDMALNAEAFDDFEAFQQLDRAGGLTARVFMYLPVGHDVEKLHGPRLRVPGLKGFADGSLGSSTAAFREPYEGETHRGLVMQPMLDGSMARWIADADARGLQLAIHAIGDRANDDVLAIFESMPSHRERRLRIEHAQHLDAELVRRFAAGKIIASMQPYHAVDDGRWAETKIGAARAQWAFPFGSLVRGGAVVTFGSDWPVAPLSPIAGIRAAVTREWIPEQRISAMDALRCYTTNNAFAVFAENEIGAIAPGMRADLAVLSGDLFTRLEQVEIDMTIFDGEVIHER
jgi:predicted amidohydrolase YtcJ